MSAAPRLTPPAIQRSSGRPRPADNFERAAVAAFMSASLGRFGGPEKAAQKLFPGDDVSWRILLDPTQRAAVSGATTSDAAFAGALAQQAVGDFFASLAPISAGSRLVNAGTRVSLDGESGVLIPRRTTAPATDIPWVGEGAPIPAKRLTLSTTQVGPGKKLAILSVLSRELARRSAAQEVIVAALREDAAASFDASLFSTAAASAVRPAGLLAGITATPATAGGGLAAMESDLEKIATAVANGGGSGNLVYVTNPAQAATIQIRKPDLQIPVWASLGVAVGTVIGIDASAFVSAFGTDADIAASIEATVHLEDTSPSHIGTAGSPNVVAAPTQNAFQTASVVLRAIVDAAWAMRTPAVAYVAGTTW